MSSIRRFDPTKLPSPWRGALERELGKLKARSDVIAVGVCGSCAQDDIWPGSDLDIEVVVRGDRPKEIFTTEQEVSVDYGYFGEKQLSEIPYDTRPVHDPSGILTRELESRVRDEVVRKALETILDRSQKVLGWAQIALAEDPYSALAWVTSASQWLAEIFTTEQEVSVDYGYFGENQLSEIPYDTRPVYDPSGILTRSLSLV